MSSDILSFWEEQYAHLLTLKEDQINFQIEGWRRKISFWFVQVAEDLKFCRETVSLALNYLMRFSVEIPLQELSCKTFQLAAITSIFVASKIEEPRPLSVTKMIELSNSFFSEEDFLCMERLLLEKLGGLTTLPTPYHFLQRICALKLIPADCLELAEGFIDVFHHETKFQLFLPSDIALSAMMCAFRFRNECFNQDDMISWLGQVPTWQIGLRSLESTWNCFECFYLFLKTHCDPVQIEGMKHAHSVRSFEP